jgi:hypothetical protein
LRISGKVRAGISDGLRIIDGEHAKQKLGLVWLPAFRTNKDVDVLCLDDELF